MKNLIKNIGWRIESTLLTYESDLLTITKNYLDGRVKRKDWLRLKKAYYNRAKNDLRLVTITAMQIALKS